MARRSHVEDLWPLNTQRREQAILQLLPLAKWMTNKYLQTLASGVVVFDDLFQEAMIGAIYAVDHYDVKRQAMLNTYAMTCIRSRMLDYQRGQDHLTRTERDRANDKPAPIRRGKPPRHLLAKLLANGPPMSLDTLLEGDEEDPPFQLAQTEHGYDRINNEMMAAEAMSLVSPRQRTLMRQYYWGQMTLRATGALRGVTEARACQIKTAAIKVMRRGMVERTKVDVR